MTKFEDYLNENQRRYLNIVKAHRMSPRTMFREAELKFRKFQNKREDIKLGYTGGRYLQALKVKNDIWYIVLDNEEIRCISMYLFIKMSVEQLIKFYKKRQ